MADPRTRRNARSSFIGSSSTGRGRARRTARAVSARRSSSSGRTTAPRRGAMPASPAAAAAAQQVEQHGLGLVVGGVRRRGRTSALERRRAPLERARTARRGPAPRGWARGRRPPRPCAERGTEARRRRRPRRRPRAALSARRPWSTCTATGASPRVGGEREQRDRVGTARAARRRPAPSTPSSSTQPLAPAAASGVRPRTAVAALDVTASTRASHSVGCVELVERREPLGPAPRGVDRARARPRARPPRRTPRPPRTGASSTRAR